MFKKNNIIYNTTIISIPCTNCGVEGHTYRSCLLPVNSYGIIAFRIKDQWSGKIKNADDINIKLCTSGGNTRTVTAGQDENGQLEVLLIRRKDSLRFVEFVRGKYSIEDEPYLYQMLANMTISERETVQTSSFDELWKMVWGTTQTRNYKNDYDASKHKFELLRDSGLLSKILSNTVSKWDIPEWGFPKGRRNPKENDYDCAVREFKEETGLKDTEFKVITNMDPLCETFYGDNNVHYCHKYYLAICDTNVTPKLDEYPHQEREIGDIRWVAVNDALGLIRDENVEKREILLRASSILRNYIIGCAYGS
jgi:8-oxo-dGTP pyrophosphatase MutT (NUDIX family)